jgi:hypothetical protein
MTVITHLVSRALVVFRPLATFAKGIHRAKLRRAANESHERIQVNENEKVPRPAIGAGGKFR